MKKPFFFAILLILYLFFMPRMTESLSSRPVSIKAGYLPSADILRPVVGEFKNLFSSWSMLRTIFYFGAIVEKDQKNINVTPEYWQMYNNLLQTVKLDPYNQDIYYFSQAIFTWDAGRIVETNQLLEYGMKYRITDWQLPFWAGFNYAFFLKDYDSAAQMFIRAGEISGDTFFKRLAGRYLQEAGKTQLAIDYLASLEKGARNPAIKKTFNVRIAAFKTVLAIEQARDRFSEAEARLPDRIDELLKSGYLAEIPADPYGGTFYFDERGQVRSTSKFSFSTQTSNPAPNSSTLPESAE